MKASRGACSPMVAPCQFRPATNVKSRDMLIACSGTFLFFEFVSLGHAAFRVAWLWSWFGVAGLAVVVGSGLGAGGIEVGGPSLVE